MNFLDLFQKIGSIVGICITLITFITLVTKKPLENFRKLIREEADGANQEIKEKLEVIEEQIEINKSNDLAIIRNTITHIYFKYKDDRKIPHYEKENVFALYERYKELGGNSYIKTVVNDISEWEEII